MKLLIDLSKTPLRAFLSVASNGLKSCFWSAQTLLFDESGSLQPPRGEFLNRALALESIRQDPTRLVFFPESLREDAWLKLLLNICCIMF